MSFAYRSAARAYASVGLETDIGDVAPGRLVVMLYEGALLSVGRARTCMLARDHASKGEKLSQAIRIIDEGLKASVDLRQGGLSQQLVQLYEYMCRQLVLAGARNDAALLDEVTRLLTDLKEAWMQIDAPATASAAVPKTAPSPTGGPPAYADPVRLLTQRLALR